MNLTSLLQQGTTTTTSGGLSPLFWIIYAVCIVAILAGWWMMFTKANKPGWAAIIPIYNYIVLLDIIGKPWWWILLMLVPFLNIIIWIIVSLELAKAYGQGTLFGIGLIILSPIFIPILGFGPAQYQGAP